jgi:transketolase
MKSSIESGLSMRDNFGQILVELGQEHPEMIVLDPDVNTSTRTSLFKREFPDRFIQLGIAEQNMFGVAAGLSTLGYVPFPCTFASFALRKAVDQFALSICFPALNVKVPGCYAGIPSGKNGASHNSVEDLAFARAIPNLKVADPGDPVELHALMQTAFRTPGPVYFRVVNYVLPKIFSDDYTFEWGKGETVISGRDVTLFSTGVMTDRSIKSAEILKKSGISVEVVHLGSIKPIDEKLIIESVKNTGCAVTAENSSIIGGLGSAISEILIENFPVPMIRVGIKDEWVDSGDVEELFSYYGMQAPDIVNAVHKVIRNKKEFKDNYLKNFESQMERTN